MPPRSFSKEDFLEAIFAQSQALPNGALGILSELAASHRCMLGVLNNEAREPNEFRFRNFGLRDQVDVAFSSCYLGLRKPNPAIYRRALDVLGKPARRTLFIDDREENAAAAEGAGMQVICFTGADALRSRLQTLEVL